MEKISTDQELSLLFPDTSKKDFVGYASKPKSPKLAPTNILPKPTCPVYANVIQLKTFDANLYLDFGFSATGASSDFEHGYETQNTIMVSSETAKKLLLTLADLFQCDLRPKQ